MKENKEDKGIPLCPHRWIHKRTTMVSPPLKLLCERERKRRGEKARTLLNPAQKACRLKVDSLSVLGKIEGR